MKTDWPDAFEGILRPFLPHLAEASELSPDMALGRLGLDSLGTVSLLVELEEYYGIMFPDEDLTSQTFATPAALWATIEKLLP